MASMPKFLYHRRHCAALRKFLNPTIPLALHRCVAHEIVGLVKYDDYDLPFDERMDVSIPALCALIHHPDTNIVLDSLSAIKHLTAADEYLQMILDSGVVPFLVSLLRNKDVEIQVAALNACSNLAAGTDIQTQAVLDCGALSHVGALLSHSDRKIIKEAFLFLSNITAGSQDQIQAVIDAGLLPDMIRYLNDTSDLGIQREAAWAVGNMTYCCNKMQMEALVENGVVQPLCNVLTSKNAKVLELGLNGINKILELMVKENPQIAEMIKECGGVDKMNVLSNYSEFDIDTLASGILQQYFSDESNTVPSNDEVPSVNEDPPIEDLSIVDDSAAQAEQSGL